MQSDTPFVTKPVEGVQEATKHHPDPLATLHSPTAAERERSEICVQEPICRPGSIQSHGVLLSADETSWTVVQASQNTDAILGVPAESLLGTPVAGLIGARAVERLVAVLAGKRGASNPVPVQSGETRFDAIVHESDGVVVLELEPAIPGGGFASVPAVYAAVARLSAATSREQLWDDAARELHDLTGFDRVMVYHFHPDGHGQVVAEERADEALEPYLGLHYPASDIPAQARELYLTKLSRTIFSTDGVSCPLVPTVSPVTGEPLDLSRAELRSVSPHHLQFMRNMGQASTLSFSLLAEGELIGMITCAHRTPRRLPHTLRQSLEVYSNLVAVQLKAMVEIGHLKRAGQLRELRSNLVEQFTLTGGLAQALLQGTVTVLDLVSAAAAAVHLDGHTARTSGAPEATCLATVARHLLASSSGMPFATDSLATYHPELAGLLPAVAGLLVIPIDGGRNWLAWFRPEITQTTSWLGDQSETNRDSTLSPRNSFSAWSSSVTDQAEPWGDLYDEAVELGRDLDSAILRHKESSLAHLSLYDELTGLPNRRLLMDRLEHAFVGRARGAEVSLLFLDLDSFKNINDSLGHDQGDAVLTQVAERLVSVIRSTDTVARIGGDEFVILCSDTDRRAAQHVAERVLAALRPPLTVDGHSLPITASIGVATAQEHDRTVSDLLRRADTSMYQAKRSGKNQAAH